jgi:transposase
MRPVESLFLKKPDRIEALLMVMTCCLMDYAALEYLIRTTLKENDAYFPDMKKRPNQNPTARWVFYCFQGIHELTVGKEESSLVVCNLKERNIIILKCLGPIYEKLYSGN